MTKRYDPPDLTHMEAMLQRAGIPYEKDSFRLEPQEGQVDEGWTITIEQIPVVMFTFHTDGSLRAREGMDRVEEGVAE